MALSEQIACRPASDVRARAVLADLVALTKPRIVDLLVMTGAAAAVVAAGGWPGTRPLAAVILGGALAAGGAGSINCALEAEIDRRMVRTSHRPVAAGRIPAWVALTQGIVLNILAVAFIAGTTNGLAAGLALSGTLWYVFVYTLWLKPRSTSNIVIGGLAGSFPPLVGWAAVTGEVGTTAIALAAVIFLWTPPHFWALATVIGDDYREAGIPMLPVVAGPRRTARAMYLYAAGTVAVSVLPVVVGDLSWIYLVAALAVGVWFTHACHGYWRNLQASSARRVFLASLAYLAVLFAAIPLDVALT